MENIKRLFSNFIPGNFIKKFTVKPFFSLEGATVLYLTLPYIIFILGWVNIFIALPITALLLFTLLSYGQEIQDRGFEKLKENWNTWNTQTKVLKTNWLLIILVLVLAWVLISGSGGFFRQNDDYGKHNSILRALIETPYPAHYDFETMYDKAYKHGDFLPLLGRAENADHAFTIVFYIAYYLPASLAGKAFGWGAALFTLFLWTLAAVLLAVFWFLRFIKHFSPLPVIVFILFSGMDVLGTMLLTKEAITGTLHMEWYAGIDLFQYSSNTSSLYWVPQHILTSWLATSLIFYNGEYKKNSKYMAFITALAIFWSPFVFLGLFPFAIYSVVKNKKDEIFTIHNLVTAPLIAGLVTLFIMSNPSDLPKGFLWDMVNLFEKWPNIFIFFLLEFGIYAILTVDRKPSPWKMIALITLVLVPLYKIGRFNDFVMRISLPSLFILLIFICRYLFDKKTEFNGSKKLLVLFLLIGAISPLAEISRSIQGDNNCPKELDRAEFIANIRLSYQYIGITDSFFFKNLSSYTPGPLVKEEYTQVYDGLSIAAVKREQPTPHSGEFYLLFKVVDEITENPVLVLTLKNPANGEIIFTKKVDFKIPYSEWDKGSYSSAAIPFRVGETSYQVFLQVITDKGVQNEIYLDPLSNR